MGFSPPVYPKYSPSCTRSDTGERNSKMAEIRNLGLSKHVANSLERRHFWNPTPPASSRAPNTPPSTPSSSHPPPKQPCWYDINDRKHLGYAVWIGKVYIRDKMRKSSPARPVKQSFRAWQQRGYDRCDRERKENKAAERALFISRTVSLCNDTTNVTGPPN
jgi:hypothetical protein